MLIKTKRLTITNFTPDMAYDVHVNSLDEDNRRFVPDEVFETVDEARETIEFLISRYGEAEGPFVHPVLLNDNTNIGYVQFVPIEKGWEIGYHIAKKYTSNGYATEAVQAFIPYMLDKLKLKSVYGICLADNIASKKVMEKCGFVFEFEGVDNYQGEQKEICRYIYKK